MNKKGFTFVELLAVIVILALILAIAVPSISSLIDYSKRNAFESNAKILLKAVQMKLLENSSFDISAINKNNLKSLLNLDSDHYSLVYVRYDSDGKLYTTITGDNKWRGLSATGTFHNLMIQDVEQVITDGLVLYMDSTNTASYPGSGNTWYDISGNGRIGTLINGASFHSVNQNTMLFDGLNDSIQVPCNYDYNTTVQYSLSTWIYPTSSTIEGGLGRTIFSSSNPISSVYMIWLLNNGLNVRLYAFSSSTGTYVETTTNPLALNTWNHVTVTAIKSGSVRIYKWCFSSNGKSIL